MSALKCFWDASAVVPLLIPEAASSLARGIWNDADESWAWDWLRVEVDAALIRRKADAGAWGVWRSVESQLNWIQLPPSEHHTLRSMNRSLELRAADAGHVYLLEKLASVYPELCLVSFDREMVEAAGRLGLGVHEGSRK